MINEHRVIIIIVTAVVTGHIITLICVFAESNEFCTSQDPAVTRGWTRLIWLDGSTLPPAPVHTIDAHKVVQNGLCKPGRRLQKCIYIFSAKPENNIIEYNITSRTERVSRFEELSASPKHGKVTNLTNAIKYDLGTRVTHVIPFWISSARAYFFNFFFLRAYSDKFQTFSTFVWCEIEYCTDRFPYSSSSIKRYSIPIK